MRQTLSMSEEWKDEGLLFWNTTKISRGTDSLLYCCEQLCKYTRSSCYKETYLPARLLVFFVWLRTRRAKEESWVVKGKNFLHTILDSSSKGRRFLARFPFFTCVPGREAQRRVRFSRPLLSSFQAICCKGMGKRVIRVNEGGSPNGIGRTPELVTLLMWELGKWRALTWTEDTS